MQKSFLLAATALTAHAAFAQAPSSTPTPQTDLAALAPESTTSSSSGVPSGSPTMTTTANSAGGCQIPAAAAGVGYNQMTYGPDMALGANWFPVTGDNATSGVSQNADGSITIRGGDANHYNNQLNSGATQFGGGGYFQATLSFQNPPAGWSTTVDGWPAFWMTPQDESVGGGVETDFFEFMDAGSNVYSTGQIDWGRGGLPAGMNVGRKPNVPPGFDPSKPHTYGWLWVPATSTSEGYGQAFLDGQAVTDKITWTPGSQFDGIDRNKAQVIFGTGSANPMTVYNAQIWQKDSSADTGIIGTTTGNSGGACPTVISANSSSPSTPSGSGAAPRGGGQPSAASSTPGGTSSGIVPQTTLASAANMGSPSTAGQMSSMPGGEWGSFNIGGTNYDVTIIDPPGTGPSYEVLIANGSTPYIIALPQGVGSGAPSSLGGPIGSGLGSSGLPSQFGNPISTDMSATPAGMQTTTDPVTGAQTTTYNATSNTGGPLSATISNQTGGGSSPTKTGSGGNGSSLTSQPETSANNSGGGGGRGRRSQQASNSASGGPNAAMAANTPSNNPPSGGSGSSNPSAGGGTAPPAASGSGSGGLSGDLTALQDQMNATAQGSNEYGGVPITLQPGDITYNSGGSLTDAQGNVWTLEPMTGQFAGVPMATVAKNGQQMDPMGGGGFVAALRIVNGEAVWENAKGKGWYNESTYVGSSPTG